MQNFEYRRKTVEYGTVLNATFWVIDKIILVFEAILWPTKQPDPSKMRWQAVLGVYPGSILMAVYIFIQPSQWIIGILIAVGHLYGIVVYLFPRLKKSEMVLEFLTSVYLGAFGVLLILVLWILTANTWDQFSHLLGN
jgi:hypothetical protein